MLSRRQFLSLAGESAVSLALAGCASSSLLKKDVFPDFGDAGRPYLGLATSLISEHNYEAQVEGNIPAQLRGTFYRIGPGIFDRNGLRKRNLLDGDGMVQAFRFHDNGVHYRNRFVQTEKFISEQAAGKYIYPSWSTQAPGGFWGNFLGAGRIKSQAGITIYLWQGRLYAFDECALPYELNPDSLETMGVSTLGLPAEMTIYAAHAKIDPHTGEWLHFGIRYGPSPKLEVTIFERNGALKMHRSLPLQRNIYLHDWFVSGQHLIFSLHPVEIEFWGFLFGLRSMAESLHWKPQKGNLIMVLDRQGDEPPLILERPACYMWHSFNAYEKGDEIVADFIGYQNPDHFVGPNPVISAVMTGQRGEYEYPGEVRRYLINPRSKTIREEFLYSGSCEWPRINEAHRCREYRYGYVAKTAPGEFFWSQISRIDMQSGGTETFDFGAGLFCSEPVFIPVPGYIYQPVNHFEPGFVLTEVYSGKTRKSFLAVFKADQLSSGPVATINLNHHAPFSYHGWWSPAN
ncbi:MAG TPA: carotenoid oxygenase family protein [Desulfuromonadaceae bacterium]|jgi:all-trans-8'-apo-beta-carotenal 15,15'-oxygenase